MSAVVEQRRGVLERGEWLPIHSAPGPREWTLGELFKIFRRRRRILAGCLTAMIAAATVYCLLATPRYLATGQIEVQRSSTGTLGLDRSVTEDAANVNADALDTTMTLETDARILQSNTLALMVVKDLKLETTEDYHPVRKRGLRLPGWLLFWRKPVEPMSVSLDAAPNRRFAVLKIFSSHLKVEPVAGTRLISVSYSNPDPKLSAAVVNRLIEALQEYTFQSRFQATAQATAWLTGQLTGLKKQTEELQQASDRLEQGTGIYGDDASQNIVLARLDGLNSALSAAESNRILKEAVYEVAKSGNPELISGLAGNATSGANPAMSNSLALLQTLRAQEAQVQAEIDEDNSRYGGSYPKIVELRGELAGIDRSIQEEIGRIGQRAHTDYEIAARAEDAARSALAKQKELADQTHDRVVAYELAKQDADGSRELYQGLLGKLKEAGVLEGLRSTNLTVVNAADEPATNRPHSPNVPLCFAGALMGGLFLGCAGALVREATDGSIRSIDDLESLLGVPLGGVVPTREKFFRFRRDRRLGAAFDDGVFPLMRTFALPPRGSSPQAILVTSAVRRDGKSRLAASFAVSLAHSGARVLLVDADLLCPSLHKMFGAKATSGLANALATNGAAEVHVCKEVPGLFVVAAGGPVATVGKWAPWNGAGLLASAHMDALVKEWRAQYDFVVLDSAPLLPFPNSASLARFCDRTLLVVRYGSTMMQAAQRGYRLIQKTIPEKAALDVVLNGVPENSPDYFAYHGYRKSDYDRRVWGHA